MTKGEQRDASFQRAINTHLEMLEKLEAEKANTDARLNRMAKEALRIVFEE